MMDNDGNARCSQDGCAAEGIWWDWRSLPFCDEHYPRPEMELCLPWYVDPDYSVQGTICANECLWYVCDNRTNIVAFVPFDEDEREGERSKEYAFNMAQRICDQMNGRAR